MALSLPPGLKPVGDFSVQVIVGAILFVLIALVAVALAGLVKWIETWNVAPEWLLGGLHWVEWGIFWVDVFSFGLFLAAEVAKLIKALWNGWRSL
jgi:uncharacterized protein involved in cysteine biosynthesis